MMRGVQHMQEELKALMRAQRFPFKWKDLKTGEEHMELLQGAYRPIEFFEYIFPKESLTDVLRGMKITGPIQRQEIKAISWLMRKMMKLKEIPTLTTAQKATGYVPQGTLNEKPIPAQLVHPMTVDGVAVYPLGIKEDKTMDHKFVLSDGTTVERYQEGV